MSFHMRQDRVKGVRGSPGAGRRMRSAQKSLGERLRDWREAKGLSQSEAAMKLKVSKRTLQEWEQGRAEPRHLGMEAIIGLISR